MVPLNTRRETREFSLQFLYHFQLPAFQDTKKNLAADSVELFERITTFRETLGVEISSKELAWITGLVKGILTNIETIEETITKYLKNWRLERISRIEHTLLVMSAYELMYQKETPFKVVINEAIELSKKYSTKESGVFINAVLDGITKEFQP
jgi:transcription antitermination protein NusB